MMKTQTSWFIVMHSFSKVTISRVSGRTFSKVTISGVFVDLKKNYSNKFLYYCLSEFVRVVFNVLFHCILIA